MQSAMESLKAKMREAEDDAAVDPSAAQRAATLRQLLAVEEPRLMQLLDEKRQRYKLDNARLKELRLELTHLEHADKQLGVTVQSEFQCWLQEARKRYPDY